MAQGIELMGGSRGDRSKEPESCSKVDHQHQNHKMIVTGLHGRQSELTEISGTSSTASVPTPVGTAMFCRMAIVCVYQAMAVDQALDPNNPVT